MPDKPPKVPPHVLSERFADPDLVDRIFDYVVELLPEIAGRAEEAKAAVRNEFAGERGHVRARDHDLADQILRMFDGRNATEVARRLHIGRATVYRTIKRAAKAKT
jgi:transcriptional regulator of acetoin/glycerol metabolism